MGFVRFLGIGRRNGERVAGGIIPGCTMTVVADTRKMKWHVYSDDGNMPSLFPLDDYENRDSYRSSGTFRNAYEGNVFADIERQIGLSGFRCDKWHQGNRAWCWQAHIWDPRERIGWKGSRDKARPVKTGVKQVDGIVAALNDSRFAGIGDADLVGKALVSGRLQMADGGIYMRSTFAQPGGAWGCVYLPRWCKV